MKLTELEGQFLAWTDDKHWRYVETLAEADGVMFVCPGCLARAGGVRPGIHSVICWQPRVPLSTSPGPGRWTFEGTGLGDLTLVAGSSSVKVGEPECAHFWVRNGEIVQP